MRSRLIREFSRIGTRETTRSVTTSGKVVRCGKGLCREESRKKKGKVIRP